jgi:hypothetical protein
MPRYTVTEPHPTVSKDAYTHSGRGGAGNFFRAPQTTPAAGVATTSKVLPPSTGRFYSGRGGAGNAHAAADRPVMSFDEQYQLQRLVEEKPAGYVGRGGAGNFYASSTSGSSSRRKESDASSRRSEGSFSSTRSGGILGRLSSSLKRDS